MVKELIQNKKWWDNHNNGVGFYATHKAINNNETRYFIGDTDEIKKHLGSQWNVYAI